MPARHEKAVKAGCAMTGLTLAMDQLRDAAAFQ
jgi:hypothetical protein